MIVLFDFSLPAWYELLLRDTTIEGALIATATAAVGIIALTTGVGGYLLRRASLPERAVLVAAGLLLLSPNDLADVAGLVLFAGVVILQFVLRRRAPSAA